MSSAVQAKPAAEAQIAFSRPSPETLVLRLSGSWRMQDRLPSATEVEAQVTSAAKAQRVAFDGQGITAWDSGLLI